MAAVMVGGGGGSGGGGLGLMSCVREASPSDVADAEEIHHHETKKRRFHPLRGLRRMFRRKSRPPDPHLRACADNETTPPTADVINDDDEEARCLDARSRSAGQLQPEQRNSANLQSGLSVSHDSIFSPEQRSPGSQSESELESSSSLSMQRLLAKSGIRAELLDAVRRRRMREEQTSEEEEEEEDLGLPRSPFSASSTTTDILMEKVLKENINKSSHSTCSDGSLLSMGSSEMDEDSYGPGSRHSSKLSLHEKKSLVSSDASPSHANPRPPNVGVSGIADLGGVSTSREYASSTPLSHSAARHKMAVRPRRTHGAPRRVARMRKHANATSSVDAGLLPVTPELNEDSSARSGSPEENDAGVVTADASADATAHAAADAKVDAFVTSCDDAAAAASACNAATSSVITSSIVTSSVMMSSIVTSSAVTSSIVTSSVEHPPSNNTTQLKSASLPLGMSAPGLSGWSDPSCKLSRSKSSAADRKHQLLDAASVVVESEEELPRKEDTSFFGRLLSRRSGKKKKNSTSAVDESPAALELPQKRMDDKGRYVQEALKLNRNHPAARQRVEPISIPSEVSSITRMHVSYSAPTPSDTEKPLDAHHIFRPTNCVIPGDVDLERQRRSLGVKKSHSFRLTTTDTPAFTSLDPTILISSTPSTVTLTNVDDSTTKVLVQDDVAAPTNVADDVGLISAECVKSEPCSSIYIKSVVLPCCPDDTVIEGVNSVEEKKPATAWDDEITVNNESLPVPLSHQITIPVNVVEGHVSGVGASDVVDVVEESVVVETSNNTVAKSSDPRQRTPDDLAYFPVPAPRPSKRESAPVDIPEFLKVQLNRFDSRKSSNVILSTSPSKMFQKSRSLSVSSLKMDNTNDKTDKERTEELDGDSITKVVDSLSPPDIECIDNDEKSNNSNSLEDYGNKNVDELEVDSSVPTEKSHVDNTPKVVELKQWSSNTTNSNQIVTGIPPRPVPNPRYSIVSITASKNLEQSEPVKSQSTVQHIVRKKSIVKDLNGGFLEQNHRQDALDKDSTNESSKTGDDTKVILRKKSFQNTEEKSNDGSPILMKQQRVFTKQKQSPVDYNNQWSRKSSFDECNERIVGEQNGKNRSKDDEVGTGSNDTCQDGGDVVLRRKPLSREVTRQNDDEPELLKVFARRSLKVKDCDLPADLEIAPEPLTKSRDSDKENECGDSPPEERKKIKEAFVETKENTSLIVKSCQKVTALGEDAPLDVLSSICKENNQTGYEKRQRSRTFPENNQKILEPPRRPVTHRVLQDVFKEKEVEVINLEGPRNSLGGGEPSDENNVENDVPLFKKIQQRKEEWEKRAQLASIKRNHP